MSGEGITRRSLLTVALGGALAARAGLGAEASDPTKLTIDEAGRRIRSKQLSSLDLTRAYLTRIERLNPRLNAFITVTSDQALSRARELDAELASGRYRGPLHGIPIALKDNIDTAGVRTTAASALFCRSYRKRTRRSCSSFEMQAWCFLGNSTCTSSRTAGHRRFRILVRYEIRGTWNTRPEAPRADRPQPLLRASVRERSAPTRPHRCACPRHFAA